MTYLGWGAALLGDFGLVYLGWRFWFKPQMRKIAVKAFHDEISLLDALDRMTRL